MKTEYKIIFISISIILIIFIMPGENKKTEINIVGSSSVQPICEQLAGEYKKVNGDVDINIQGGGSSLGIKCVDNNLTDIGMSSKEVNSNAKTYELGREGIVIVVNKNNAIKDLSTFQIQNIFSGKISDWSEISNESGKINVIVREEGSGTLDAFKKIIMKNNQIKDDAIIQNSLGAVQQAVIQDENAISFVSFTQLDTNLKNISIDGVEISQKTIQNGSYKLQRPFLLLTNQNTNNETQDFIDWIFSDEGNEILLNEKIIRVD